MLKVNGNVLLIARAKECLKQDELAKKAGVGRTTIARIENGSLRKASPVIVGKLSKALNISVEELILQES